MPVERKRTMALAAILVVASDFARDEERAMKKLLQNLNVRENSKESSRTDSTRRVDGTASQKPISFPQDVVDKVCGAKITDGNLFLAKSSGRGD